VQTSQWLAAHGFPHGVIFHRPKGVKGGLFKERVLRCLHQPPMRHVIAHVGDRPMEDALAAVKTGVRPVLIAPNEWTGRAHSASQECNRPAGWVKRSTLESIVVALLDDESREGKQPSRSSREVAEGRSLLRESPYWSSGSCADFFALNMAADFWAHINTERAGVGRASEE